MTEQARIETAVEMTIDNCELFREKIAALEAGNESLRLVRDDYKRQADEYRTKWAALSVRAIPEVWTPAADQVPQSGKAVLAHYKNSHGMSRRIRAEYIAAWTVQVDDLSDTDTECVEYSEQDDAYYLTAGWYELVDNWDEYGRIAVTEGVITHWMPMPSSPAMLSAAPTPAPVEPAHSELGLNEWAAGKFGLGGRFTGQLYGNTDWALTRVVWSAALQSVNSDVSVPRELLEQAASFFSFEELGDQLRALLNGGQE